MSNARFSILQAKAVKDKRITDAQFRTLAALGMYADENGWCFPKQATVGKDISKSRQAINRDIKALKELVYLEVKPQYKDDGTQRANLYRLLYDLDSVTPVLQGVKHSCVTGGETSGGDSITTQENDPRDNIESIKKSANKTVDAVLDFARQAEEKFSKNEAWPHRDKFPDPIRELLDVYVKLTGQRPAKKDVSDWLLTGQDWLDLGILPADLMSAYKKSKPDEKGWGGFTVARPGGLTRTAGMFAGERRTNGKTVGNKYERALAQLEAISG